MKEIDIRKVSTAGLLITLGIIFGDIGTSPLYVLKAIVGDQAISRELIYGAISCIFWTLTLQTTIKYVLITLQADNHGEGGIFSLFTLVRKRKSWLYIIAVVGGSTLLADSIITPSISVSSAVEGLSTFNESIPTIPIVIAILVFLFFLQQFGSGFIGSTFGPIMFVWFTMLGILGGIGIALHPEIVNAFNPFYAYDLLVHYPQGFWILGAVFLCTTGAEALYSDMGHCGKKNIQISWILVKVCLLINYLGQGAYLLQFEGQKLSVNPFYALMPSWFLIPGIIIATLAVIVASQALISGAFTLINEAIRLNFWPKTRIKHPTNLRGQIYIPAVNFLLMLGCIGVVLFFKKSSNMEAAYGLSIIITMIMTSFLLIFYLIKQKVNPILITLFVVVYGTVEISFLWANLEKFTHGGWITPMIASVLTAIMLIWYFAGKIRRKYMQFQDLKQYLELFNDLSNDKEIPKFASNLVYLTTSEQPLKVESKITHSLFNRFPKRADTYWFLHVDVQNKPYTMEYKVTELYHNKVYRVDFKLGFRVEPKIGMMLQQVVEEMVQNHQIDITSRYSSLNKNKIAGDFRYVILERFLSYEHNLPNIEKLILNAYFFLKSYSLSEEKAFGLDASSVVLEKVPMHLSPSINLKLQRIE